MSSQVQVPDDLDAYFSIESRCGRFYEIHTKRLGLILDEIDCEGDAKFHIQELEAADAKRAADEARQAAEDAAFDAVLDVLSAPPSVDLRNVFAVAAARRAA